MIATPNRPARVHTDPLTRREFHMLQLVADGYSNQEIANVAFVSRNTVKFHLKNLFSKLGTSRRTQAVAIAERIGLLDRRKPAPTTLIAA